MLLDITFFDDAVPTSTLSRPSGAEAAAAALAGPAGDQVDHGTDVTDWASVIAKLKIKLTRTSTYRYVVFPMASLIFAFSNFCTVC